MFHGREVTIPLYDRSIFGSVDEKMNIVVETAHFQHRGLHPEKVDWDVAVRFCEYSTDEFGNEFCKVTETRKQLQRHDTPTHQTGLVELMIDVMDMALARKRLVRFTDKQMLDALSPKYLWNLREWVSMRNKQFISAQCAAIDHSLIEANDTLAKAKEVIATEGAKKDALHARMMKEETFRDDIAKLTIDGVCAAVVL